MCLGGHFAAIKMSSQEKGAQHLSKQQAATSRCHAYVYVCPLFDYSAQKIRARVCIREENKQTKLLCLR